MTELSRIREFRLSPLGVSCGEDGLYVGGIPLLKCERQTGNHEIWTPRPVDDLNCALTAYYDLPIDAASKIGGMTTVAKALNRGDLILANIAAVQLQFPDLPSLEKADWSFEDTAHLAAELRLSGLLKIDWNPAKHPRWPAKEPEGRGGQFAPKGDGESDAARNASPIIPAQMTTPWVEPWDLPLRIPVPLTEITPPPISIPDGMQREGIPQNPYPSRPECVEEWAAATEFCQNLKDRGLLGRGDYKHLGKNLWECMMGQVSKECGGNATGA